MNSQAVRTMSQGLGTNSEAVRVTSEELGTNSGAVRTMSEALGTNSEAVRSRSEALGMNSEAVRSMSRGLGTNSEAVRSTSEALGTNDEAAHSTSEALGTNGEAVRSMCGGLGTNGEAAHSRSEGLGTNGDAVRTTRGSRHLAIENSRVRIQPLRDLPIRRRKTNMGQENKLELEARNNQIVVGIKKNLAGNKKLTIGGVDYTPASLIAVFTDDTAAMKAVAANKKVFEQSVADERTAHALTAEVTVALKSFILGFFGLKAVTVLGDFGFSAPKTKGKKTVAVKAAAIEQSTATREARHTMGPKQKKKIKGTVAGADNTAATSAGAATGTGTAGAAGGTKS